PPRSPLFAYTTLVRSRHPDVRPPRRTRKASRGPVAPVIGPDQAAGELEAYEAPGELRRRGSPPRPGAGEPRQQPVERGVPAPRQRRQDAQAAVADGRQRPPPRRGRRRRGSRSRPRGGGL